jgi:bifunctional oligoribonuclease and PAP phosphatase NrnA
MKKFKQDIEESKKILITSHINCDQDGISSALATKLLIDKKFPEKELLINIESELQNNISFLKGFSEIKTDNLADCIKKFKPEMIIFTDGQKINRFSSNYEEVQELIEKEKITIAVIDHHESETTFIANHHYNNLRSSCAEEVYHLFVTELEFKMDKDIAEVILTGMIFDTGVFTYKNNHFRETMNTVADLVEYGVAIENILYYKNRYSRQDLEIISELSKNLVVKEDFCYTYISDKFFKEKVLKNKIPLNLFNSGRHIWTRLFLKNIEYCKWGFIIYQSNFLKEYVVTVRSRQVGKTAREFAEKFGGGGHDQASGFSILAKSVKLAEKEILKKI